MSSVTSSDRLSGKSGWACEFRFPVRDWDLYRWSDWSLLFWWCCLGRRACRSHPGVDTGKAEASVPAPRFGGRPVVRYIAVANVAAPPGEDLARALFCGRLGSRSRPCLRARPTS